MGRVLVVDGYPDAADSIALLLRLWGYDVAVAYSGPAAVDVARTYHPDVVLTELCVPEVNGFQVARRLRGQAVLVALTGIGLEAYRRRAQEAGFSHFLVKPVDPGQLHELLRGTLPSVVSTPRPSRCTRSPGRATTEKEAAHAAPNPPRGR